MLIGISGKYGSGKDTAFKLLQAWYPSLENKKFADKLKAICAILSGYTLATMYAEDGKELNVPGFNITVGELQQQVGTEAFRSWDTDVWVKALMADYDADKNWVITDVRFPNEAYAIKAAGGILVRLIGKHTNTKRDPNHISETALDDFQGWDYVIHNDGSFRDLAVQLNEVIQPIISNEYLSPYDVIQHYIERAQVVINLVKDLEDGK